MNTYRYYILAAALTTLGPTLVSAQQQGVLHDARETHLGDVRQLTSGAGENAEAYWSPDGSSLIFQSTRTPYACDQIFTLPVSDPAAVSLVSTGEGRTTCGYFSASGDRIVYSSTHASGLECPVPPDRSRGYVWPIYDSYQIYSAAPDGADLVALTDTDAYDAEATVCSRDGSIVFTSTRDGDLDLYRMDADGGNVKRLTDAPGYDGGAFFSPDCSQIVWRASRPTGEALTDYQALLAEGLVRPSELEIWVANAAQPTLRRISSPTAGASFSRRITTTRAAESSIYSQSTSTVRSSSVSPTPKASTVFRCSRRTAVSSHSARIAISKSPARQTSTSRAGSTASLL
jgi:Tol biopolymer transport system component